MIPEDYSRYCHEGACCEPQWIDINDKVSLRILTFSPATGNNNIPVLIVGGLSTIIDSFIHITRELSRDFTLHFIETRDRPSSKIDRNERFDIPAMAEDIAIIVGKLKLEEDRYVLMGYSLGATTVAESYHLLDPKPKCILFMEPTPVFHYPRWSLVAIRWFGLPLYRIMKPIAKWYLRHFRIDTSQDREMYVISSRSLDNADPVKLRKTILAIAPYTVWERLGDIICPVLMVATTKDKLHDHEETMRMVSLLMKCSYADLETNLRTHSPEMGQVIRNYICGLDNRGDYSLSLDP